MTSSLANFGVKFGTSGARGLVSDLTADYCRTFTAAFLGILEPGPKRLLVGHDLRASSPAIAANCIAAAEAAGVACVYGGALPTPALALAALEQKCPAIMVTGSHIPDDRNGIKAYRPDGEITKLDEQAMLRFEAELPPVHSVPALPAADTGITRRYADRYTQAFAKDALGGLRIGVYEHSTVMRDLLHEVLRALGAETTGLGRSEAFLPVDTEAIRPEDQRLAATWAAGQLFDAIVSADGDADRPLVADERGQWLRGDVLGVLSARELGARTVVTPVSSNTAVEKCGIFAHTVRTRIGSPFVIAAMSQPGLRAPVVGYEANGGFLLGSGVTIGSRKLAALPTRDALLPIILVLAAARQRGCSMSDLVRGLPPRFTASDRLQNYASGRAQALIEELMADPAKTCSAMAPEAGKIAAIDHTDGYRVTFASGGIVHLRPSGNAPELRCYAEAGTPEGAATLCRTCLTRIALS